MYLYYRIYNAQKLMGNVSPCNNELTPSVFHPVHKETEIYALEITAHSSACKKYEIRKFSQLRV